MTLFRTQDKFSREDFYASERYKSAGPLYLLAEWADIPAAGLNVVRMNFSHGSHDVSSILASPTLLLPLPSNHKLELIRNLQYHQSVIDNARESAKTMPGRPLAIALDTVSYSSLNLPP